MEAKDKDVSCSGCGDGLPVRDVHCDVLAHLDLPGSMGGPSSCAASRVSLRSTRLATASSTWVVCTSPSSRSSLSPATFIPRGSFSFNPKGDRREPAQGRTRSPTCTRTTTSRRSSTSSAIRSLPRTSPATLSVPSPRTPLLASLLASKLAPSSFFFPLGKNCGNVHIVPPSCHRPDLGPAPFFAHIYPGDPASMLLFHVSMTFNAFDSGALCLTLCIVVGMHKLAGGAAVCLALLRPQQACFTHRAMATQRWLAGRLSPAQCELREDSTVPAHRLFQRRSKRSLRTSSSRSRVSLQLSSSPSELRILTDHPSFRVTLQMHRPFLASDPEKGDMHPDARRKPRPEFEGETQPQHGRNWRPQKRPTSSTTRNGPTAAVPPTSKC
ncbi:hypothetical protein L1887_58861 [Cichorium endivia]|nr:hypothetical protein L1887_58861 [Cichorium endivia]